MPEWVCWPVFAALAACAGTGKEMIWSGTAYASYRVPIRTGKVRGVAYEYDEFPSRGVVGGRCAPGGGFCGGHVWPTAAGCGAVSTWWPMAVSMPRICCLRGCPRSAGCRAVSQQRLYALYPAGMLVGDGGRFAALSRRTGVSPDAFDTEAVLMVAAPVEAEIPQEGTAYGSRSDSLTIRVTCGCRRRICRRLLSDERVSRIVPRAWSGSHGRRFYGVDRRCGRRLDAGSRCGYGKYRNPRLQWAAP